MKKISLVFVLTALLLQGCVTNKRFSNTTLVASTELKHQKFTGQCWSFASTSLLEAEAMRLGYDIPELSSFYFVYLNYLDNAEDYINNNGTSRLNRGDLTFSVLEIFEKYGAVPEAVYDGNLGVLTSKKQMMNRWKEEDEMNALIKQKLDSLIKTNASVDQSLEIVKNILNEYMGEIPARFTFKEKTETPKTFANKYVPLNAKDYIELTSYNHHPFYQKVMLEIPANWRYKKYMNLPIDGFMSTIDNAIKSGFTLAWDGDIGHKEGFKDHGYVRVKGEYEDEKLISQEQRQSAYERGTTRDDHNMHLVGYTYDRKGEKFYMLKNTWGKNRGMDGVYYLSENYFRLRTISVTVHKDGFPEEIKTKIEW
ncbi:MAG: C1 family peptidase [Thermonemataceae bacterium]